MPVRKVATGKLHGPHAEIRVSPAYFFATAHSEINALEDEITKWRHIDGKPVRLPREGVSLVAWNYLRNVRALLVQLEEQWGGSDAVTLRSLVGDVEPTQSAERDSRERESR